MVPLCLSLKVIIHLSSDQATEILQVIFLDVKQDFYNFPLKIMNPC